MCFSRDFPGDQDHLSDFCKLFTKIFVCKSLVNSISIQNLRLMVRSKASSTSPHPPASSVMHDLLFLTNSCVHAQAHVKLYTLKVTGEGVRVTLHRVLACFTIITPDFLIGNFVFVTQRQICHSSEVILRMFCIKRCVSKGVRNTKLP